MKLAEIVTSETPTAVLLADMLRAGVTDSVAEEPFSFLCPAVPVQTIVPEPSLVTAVQQAIVNDNDVSVAVNVADMVEISGEKADISVVLVGNKLEAAEEILFKKMLAAANLSEISINYMIVAEGAQGVSSFCQQKLTELCPAGVIAFGQTAACAVLGEDSTLSALRGKSQQIGQLQLMTTYHPRVLLAQPALKRLAWQDMLAFTAHIKGVSA